MKNIINTINTAGAYRTVLAELHLNDSDVEFSNITMHDGLYEANLFTAWMHYECCVDAATSRGARPQRRADAALLHGQARRQIRTPEQHAPPQRITRMPRLQAGAQMKKPRRLS